FPWNSFRYKHQHNNRLRSLTSTGFAFQSRLLDLSVKRGTCCDNDKEEELDNLLFSTNKSQGRGKIWEDHRQSYQTVKTLAAIVILDTGAKRTEKLNEREPPHRSFINWIQIRWKEPSMDPLSIILQRKIPLMNFKGKERVCPAVLLKKVMEQPERCQFVHGTMSKCSQFTNSQRG
ncbi:Hypothetical predicted protein, partial [Paramuricea clavata]